MGPGGTYPQHVGMFRFKIIVFKAILTSFISMSLSQKKTGHISLLLGHPGIGIVPGRSGHY